MPQSHDIFSSSKRSEIMRAIPQKGTKPELAVRRLVHGLGYRYRLHCKNLPGNPDLVFPARRKIIFMHGCFWHRHKNCSRTTVPKTHTAYWKAKFAANIDRDRIVLDRLNASGWQVLVVWQCEISKRAKLTQTIKDFLSPSQPSRQKSKPFFWIHKLFLWR